MININTKFVGLDIDDKRFCGCLYNPVNSTFESFVCKPTFGALSAKLRSFIKSGHTLKICYESGYLGFSLQRDLAKAGFDCEIVATSLIPMKPGPRVKTDRLDAIKLAEYFAKGMLVSIYIPDEKDEQVRDLLRSRDFIKDKLKEYKNHFMSTCRRHNLDYKQEAQAKHYWTTLHRKWLRNKIKSLEATSLKFTLESLLYMIHEHEQMIEKIEHEILLISNTERYQKQVQALSCFRGINTYGAMSLVCEIGDIRRFTHPKKLVSYAGMGIREYSSGGKERKRGITKTGNRRIRKVLIEACQCAKRPPKVSRRLEKARKDQDQNIVEISQKCMWRLHKKSTRLIFSGKHVNKVKVAAAREMLGFIWETLHKIA